MSDSCTDITEKGEFREDLLQISFSKVSIIWDLNYDENREVSFVERIDQLFSYNKMVKTGLVPHEQPEMKDDWRVMKKVAF